MWGSRTSAIRNSAESAHLDDMVGHIVDRPFLTRGYCPAVWRFAAALSIEDVCVVSSTAAGAMRESSDGILSGRWDSERSHLRSSKSMHLDAANHTPAVAPLPVLLPNSWRKL
jgi:hypothetical protein